MYYFRIDLLQCWSYLKWSIRYTSNYFCVTHVFLKELKILHDILFFLSISYTEPYNFLLDIFVVDEEYIWILTSFSFWKSIPINHEILDIWKDFINTINLICIQTSLYISANNIIFLTWLFWNLTRWVSLEDIFMKPFSLTKSWFQFSFISFYERSPTIFTSIFWFSGSIFTILFYSIGTTLRTFFLA